MSTENIKTETGLQLSLREQLSNQECTIIVQSLIDCKGNESEVSRRLKISRTALRYKLKKYREKGLLNADI